MDGIEATLRRLFAALDSHTYDLGVLADRSMFPRLESCGPPVSFERLPYLKYRNVHGGNLYFRPFGESRFTLLDDLTPESLTRLSAEGFAPSAVVETSPGNYQAWLKHLQPLPKELSTLAAKLTAERFGAERERPTGGVSDGCQASPIGSQSTRMRTAVTPFARLITCSGDRFPQAEAFHAELTALFERQKAEQRESRSRSVDRPIPPSLTLARFRSASRYLGQPAAADMAFAIAAYAQGWADQDIAAELAANYLSRDPSQKRRDMYIRRNTHQSPPMGRQELNAL